MSDPRVGGSAAVAAARSARRRRPPARGESLLPAASDKSANTARKLSDAAIRIRREVRIGGRRGAAAPVAGGSPGGPPATGAAGASWGSRRASGRAPAPGDPRSATRRSRSSATARTGTLPRKSWSLRSTPSPSGSFLPPCVGRHQVAADDAQRDVDHVVGQPAAVREPGVVAADHAEAVLGSPTAATPRLIFSVSAGAGLLPICVTPGMPVSSAWTMSVRLVLLDAEVEQLVQRRGRERREHVLAEVRRSAGRLRAVELVLERERDHQLVDRAGCPAGSTWTQRLRRSRPRAPSPSLVTCRRRRSVDAQTPTTALPAVGPDDRAGRRA